MPRLPTALRPPKNPRPHHLPHPTRRPGCPLRSIPGPGSAYRPREGSEMDERRRSICDTDLRYRRLGARRQAQRFNLSDVLRPRQNRGRIGRQGQGEAEKGQLLRNGREIRRAGQFMPLHQRRNPHPQGTYGRSLPLVGILPEEKNGRTAPIVTWSARIRPHSEIRYFQVSKNNIGRELSFATSVGAARELPTR